jgi:putative Holliday junction resolvase
MRYLAIDYGLKRTGLAICDADEIICSPLEVIDNPKNLVERIVETIRSYQVEALVMGLPYNMDGTEGDQAKIVRAFTERLKSKIGDMPIHFQDERLSSFDAGSRLEAGDYTRGKKKKRLDAVAAAAILESFIEAQKGTE